MEFPYREIHGFEDAQGNFEFLGGLSLLQLLVPGVQDPKGAVGAGTMTWGGLPEASITVPHGLGRTPKFVAAFAQGVAPGGTAFYMTAQNPADATNLYLWAYTVTGAAPPAGAGGAFVWIAVG